MSYCTLYRYDFKFIQVLYLYFIKRCIPNCNLYSVNTNSRYQENSLEHYVQLLSRTNQTTFLRMVSFPFSRVIDFCTWKTCDRAQLYYWNIMFRLFICSLKNHNFMKGMKRKWDLKKKHWKHHKMVKYILMTSIKDTLLQNDWIDSSFLSPMACLWVIIQE